MSNYLKIVEKAKPKNGTSATVAEIADEVGVPARSIPADRQTSVATKATEATKAPLPAGVCKEPPRDKSDRSDKRSPSFTPLTVSEALAEINRRGSGAGKNAELYRRGELSEVRAVEYVTCAILHRRGQSFEVWRHHAPAVRKALTLCIHELPSEACKVCNGYVKKLIEQGGAA